MKLVNEFSWVRLILNEFQKKEASINNYFYIIFFIVFNFFGLSQSIAQTTAQPFTNTGSWTSPAGITKVTVECWGGGGAGGGANLNSGNNGGGGGAGGAYAKKALTITPGTFTVTVAGASTGSLTAIVNGNDSWFGSTSTVIAKGGAGGNPNNGAGGIGTTTGSLGDIVLKGGNGFIGSTTQGSAGGGGAGSTIDGGNATILLPGGGGSLNGGFGGVLQSTRNPGNSGQNYGGGGGGGFANTNTDQQGGNGAQGYAIVTFVRPTSVVSGSASICAGNSATISIALTGTAPWTLTYTDLTTPVTVSGILTSPYTFNVSPNSTKTYTVTSLSDGNTATSMTWNAEITVNPSPTLLNATQTEAVCPGSSATITLLGLVNNSTSTINYSIDGVPQTPVTGVVATGTSASFSTSALTSANNGQTLQITGITISAAPNCSASFSRDVILSVNPAPTLTGASQLAPVCSGASATINLTGLSAGSTSIINYTIDGVAQTPVTGVIADVGGLANFSTVVLTPANDSKILRITGVTKTSTIPNCSASFTQDLALSVFVTPTITLAASATSVCFSASDQTTSLTYSATSGTPTTYSIAWNPSPLNSFLPVTDMALSPPTQIMIDIPAGTPVGTYTGNLTVKNASGCVSSSSSFTLTVNGEPAITLAATAASVCFNSGAQTTSLTYSSPTNSPTNYSITWDATTPSNSFVTVTNAALPASPITIAVPAGTSPGIYTGNLTVRNGGCIGSATSIFTVTVNALPTIALAASATSVCFSSGAQTTPLTYGATSETPTTYSITWNSTPSNTFAAISNVALPASPISIPVPAGTLAGIYTGNLTVKNANGCVSATSVFTVTVNALPIPTFTAQPGPFGCAGGGGMTYTTESGQSNYNWVFPGTLGNDYTITSGGTNISNTVTLNWITAGSKVVTINYTNSNGCTAVAATSSTATTIYSGTPATPGSITGASSQCATSTGSYSIALVSEATSYTWSQPAGWTIDSGNGTATISVTSGAAGADGNITVTASNFCGTSSARTLAVTVTPRPTIALNTMPTVCLGTTVANITYSGTTQTPNQYSINFDAAANTAGFSDVVLVALPSSPIVITVPATNVSGVYNGMLTVTNGTCSSVGYAITVSVNAVTSGIPSNPAAVCLNGTALLSPTDATGSGTITYQWQNSTTGLPGSFTNIPFATDAAYSTPPVTAPKYYVRVATSTLNGVPCSATTSLITVSTTGVLNTLITDGSPLNADWKNPLAWLNILVPTIDQGTLGCPVTVTENLVLDNSFSGTTNLEIRRGVVLIDATVTDVNQSNMLLMAKPGSDEAESVLDIKSGTTTFLGGASITSATLIVRTGATLILGQQTNCKCLDIPGYLGANNTLPLCSDLPSNPLNNPTVPVGNMLFIGNKSKIIVENGGFIIVNGNVENRSNAGNILVNGYLYISGDYKSFTGNVSVTQDNFGVGDMYACGVMNSNGASTILGSTIDCTDTTVPCVATNLLCSARVNISPYGEVGWCNGTVLTATLINSAPANLLTWESSTNLTTWSSAGNAGKTVYQWGAGALPEVIANPVTPTYYRAKITKVASPPLVPVGCSSLSFISYVVPGQNRWRGIDEVPLLQTPLKPDDWNNIANWCAYIPNSTSPITRINTGNPTIYGNDIANVNSIELFPGTSIKLNGTSPTLNIYGNLINNGEISDILESGTVNFKGNINMTGSGLYQLNNITVDPGFTVSFPVNPSEIEISGDINFDGIALFVENGSEITLTGGADQTIDANGNQFWDFNLFKSSNANINLTSLFILKGRIEMFSASTLDSDGNLFIRSRGVSTEMDGSIGYLPPGGSVINPVTIERWMNPIPGEPYRYIASPVQGGYIASAVDRLYRYSPVTGWAKSYSPMSIGEGFAALTWNKSAQITWSVTGVTDSDSFGWTFPTAGWYLIGNPYPAPIKWSSSIAGGWTLTNVATTIGITENDVIGYPNYFRYYDYINGDQNPNWSPLNEVITNGVIAMGQAFWVYSGGVNASITVNQAAKRDDGSFYREKEGNHYDQLIVKLDNGKVADQGFLRLHDKATDEFELNHDLPKLWNEKMNVFLMSESKEEMLIHTVKEIPAEVKIPVGVRVTEPGEYYISFGGLKESSNLAELYLIDTFEGVAIPVSTTERYSFIVKDVSKPITDRFYLSLTSDVESSKEALIDVYPNPVNDRLIIQVSGEKGNTSIMLMDVNGKILESSDFKGDGSIDMVNYPEGMYILKVKTANGIVTKKIVKQD